VQGLGSGATLNLKPEHDVLHAGFRVAGFSFCSDPEHDVCICYYEVSVWGGKGGEGCGLGFRV
jgi:hypothetical protein